MKVILKDFSGYKYEVLAFDNDTHYYLLKRIDKDESEIFTPFIVIHELLGKNDTRFFWSQGEYFCTKKEAKKYFVERIAEHLDGDSLDKLFECIYSNTSYFIKFKMILKNERSVFRTCNEDEWNTLYQYFMSNDKILGFMPSELLDKFEDELYGMREEEDDE